MQEPFDDLFFEHLKRETSLVGEIKSPKLNCRRWIQVFVYRHSSLDPGDGLGSPLSRFAVGPFHWHMIVFDFNHVEHSLDDIDDPEDKTGVLYRELVVEVKTTDIDLYKELLILLCQLTLT